MHMGRHVIDQVKDRLVDDGCRDEMVVVEDQQNWSDSNRDVVDQHGHGRFRGRQLGSLCEALSDVGMDRLQRSDQIGKELGWVVVALL